MHKMPLPNAVKGKNLSCIKISILSQEQWHLSNLKACFSLLSRLVYNFWQWEKSLNSKPAFGWTRTLCFRFFFMFLSHVSPFLFSKWIKQVLKIVKKSYFDHSLCSTCWLVKIYNTHTHTLSLSLSLSFTHTHTIFLSRSFPVISFKRCT